MTTGYKRPLIDDDIWKLENDNKARHINELVEKEWQKEMDKMKRYTLLCKKKPLRITYNFTPDQKRGGSIVVKLVHGRIVKQ